jgi:cytosine deaminase
MHNQEKNKFMQIALDLALQSGEEVPVAAVITRNNEIISSSINQIMKSNDPTAHAEMLAIKLAAEHLKTRFLTDCEIYITLEPCPMCAYAISLARMKSIYFAAYDKKRGAISNSMINNTFLHKPKIYDGIMEKDSNLMLTEFFKKLRQRSQN